MIDLIKKIHEGYGTSNSVGIQYIEQFRDEIVQYNAKDIFVYLMENYSCKFICELLLSSIDLINSINSNDWVSILENSKRKANPLDDNNDGYYADIYFLIKYFGLDFFDYLLNSDNLSLDDKKNLLSFCKLKAPQLTLDEFDIEDMDGEYFISFEAIKSKRRDLLENSALKEAEYSDIYKHLEELECEFNMR